MKDAMSKIANAYRSIDEIHKEEVYNRCVELVNKFIEQARSGNKKIFLQFSDNPSPEILNTLRNEFGIDLVYNPSTKRYEQFIFDRLEEKE